MRALMRGAVKVVLFVAPTLLSAQGITVVGSVKDELGNPVPGAEVRMGSTKEKAMTDEEGRYRLTGVSLGLQSIGARRIGYLPASDLIRLTSSDTVDFQLDRIGQRLDTVRVQTRADAAWERDLRRYAYAIDAARSGDVITDRDIESRNAMWTTDLLQTQIGFRTIGNGPTARLISTRGNCGPTIFIDGLPVVGFNVNDIPPNTIKLLVTYRNVATLPVQLQLPRTNPNCGVVAIFSK
jgi:hypothetical protein